MPNLARTSPDRLVDSRGRPYFLWDEDMTLDQFRARLRDDDPAVVPISSESSCDRQNPMMFSSS